MGGTKAILKKIFIYTGMLYMKIRFRRMSSGTYGYSFGGNKIGSLSYTIYKNKCHMERLNNKNYALNIGDYMCILGRSEPQL